MIRHKAVLAALLFGAAGCGFTHAAPKPAPKHAEKASADFQNMGITGGGIVSTQPDPKNPKWLLWKLNAAGFSGQGVSNGFQITVNRATATLFKQGKPAAVVTAPKASGDSVGKIMVLSGGILVNSLVEKGTQLRADRAIWYSKTNKIVADGHVVYRSGKSGMTVSGPELVADTALKTIHSSAPGQVVWPKGF